MRDTSTLIEPGFELDSANVILNPSDEWYAQYLKPYYVQTRDGQYLFGTLLPGRRPDLALYAPPRDYPLGKGQKRFDPDIVRKLYDVVRSYLKTCKVIVLEGIQGEAGHETGLRIVLSVQNPHAAYCGWMGKLMIFPPKPHMNVQCWNYIVQEQLPKPYVDRIHEFWPEYDPTDPLTLYDFTEMDLDKRRVLSIGMDYFGGAFKKPNLTMVWNRGEADGLISYHAGCTSDRLLKGLSGTGKTTLTVGPELQQDDAVLGKPYYDKDGRIETVQLIGLEAASFAKSEGLTPDSPEWPGLMKSQQTGPDGKRPVVLAMNIDCEGVEYKTETIAGFRVKVPHPIPGEAVGSPQCTRYEKSKTTNGRFIFHFSEINKDWTPGTIKWLRTEALSFRRFDIVEPIFRVVDPAMAVALDSGCESIITSAIAGQIVGTRTRSYAATDFMVRQYCHQAMLKWKMYADLGLGIDGKLVFFINNSGYVGEYDIDGRQILKRDAAGNPIPKIDEATGRSQLDGSGKPVFQGHGEKIKVRDTKTLVDLIEHRKIKSFVHNPVYGYLVPDPLELEEVHGLTDFRKRFNPLRYYTPEQIVEFYKRDITERTGFLRELFAGEVRAKELEPVISVWENCSIPSPKEIEEYYLKYYGEPK